MTNLSNPIRSGVQNGIPYQSLTHLQVARETILLFELQKYNVYRKEIGLNPFGASEFLKHRYGLTLFQYINKPLTERERLLYYRIKGQYFNNVGFNN